MNCLKSITQNKGIKLFSSRVNMSGLDQDVLPHRKKNIGTAIFVAVMVGAGVMHVTINKSFQHRNYKEDSKFIIPILFLYL